VDSEKATFDDIEKLNRADTMQLYYAADAPDFGSMKGEYEGRLLSGACLAALPRSLQITCSPPEFRP